MPILSSAVAGDHNYITKYHIVPPDILNVTIYAILKNYQSALATTSMLQIFEEFLLESIQNPTRSRFCTLYRDVSITPPVTDDI